MTDTAKLAGLRVLVVEDEMMVSMLIEDMLTDLGCVVVGPASRLDEAIELAGRAEIDCAVLDVNLGGQPIFPLADLLRAKGAPFAFATGYGDAGLRAEDKGSPLLQKPFRIDMIRELLGSGLLHEDVTTVWGTGLDGYRQTSGDQSLATGA